MTSADLICLPLAILLLLAALVWPVAVLALPLFFLWGYARRER